MRRILVVMSLLAACGSLSTIPADACGDKLLVIGRGMRFQGLSAVRPASILAYVRPGARSSAAIHDPAFQGALKKAGHKLRIVEDEEEFKGALQSGEYDVVLADISDAANLEESFRFSPANPVVLPVVYEGTKAETQAAERRYQCVLKTPNKSGGYLSAIEKAMEIKAKGKRKKVLPGS